MTTNRKFTHGIDVPLTDGEHAADLRGSALIRHQSLAFGMLGPDGRPSDGELFMAYQRKPSRYKRRRPVAV